MEGDRGVTEALRDEEGTPPPDDLGRGWDYFVRQDLVEQVRRALLHGYGAVLEGEPGAGKLALANTVLRQIRENAHVIHLDRNGLDGPGLEVLLTRLPEQDADGHRTLMDTIREEVFRVSGGLPVVLFVPDAQVLGEAATGVLANLTLSGTFSLLTIAHNQGTEDPPGLLSAVHLERIYLEPLSLQETRRMLRHALGGEPSKATVFGLWSGTAGHRRLLEALTRDWHDAGYLSAVNGVWVVSGNHWPVGDRTRRVWRDLLAELPPEQREVLELVALANRIPLHELLSLVAMEDVDSVHALGYLEFGSGHVRRVKLRGPAASTAVAEQVPPGRAAMLLERLRMKTAAPWPVDAMHLHDWESSAGINPPPELALEAAELALGAGDPAAALGFLDGAAALGSEPRYLDVFLRALLRASHHERINDVVEHHGLDHWELAPGTGTGADVERLAGALGSRHDFKLALTSLLLSSEARKVPDAVIHGLFRDLVERIRETGAEALTDVETRNERAATANLHLLELAAYRGQPGWCAEFPYSVPDLDGHRLWRWQLLLNANAVSLGDVKTGIQRGRELTLLVHHMATSGHQRLATRVNLFALYVVAGEWTAAAEVIDGSWVGGHESRRLDDASNLYSGIIMALQGRSAEAIARLRHELVQRRVFDPEGAYGIGLAAAAYACAALGERDEAEEYLYAVDELDAVPVQANALIARSIWYLRALAVAELGREGEAIDELMNTAERDRERGRVSWELLALSAAAMLGHEPALGLLGERAAASNGRFAGACRQFSEALLSGTPEEKHAAARTFEMLGHPRLAAACREPGPGNGTRRRKAAQRAAKVIALPESGANAERPTTAGPGKPPALPAPAASGAVPAFPGMAGPAPLSTLTARQLDTARLAATGQSNREIADHLSLSVRTVESHLYQIYSRLGVAGRTELAHVLASLRE